jgi:ABC-type uncharacterized transport system ATPase component
MLFVYKKMEHYKNALFILLIAHSLSKLLDFGKQLIFLSKMSIIVFSKEIVLEKNTNFN